MDALHAPARGVVDVARRASFRDTIGATRFTVRHPARFAGSKSGVMATWRDDCSA